MVKSIGDYCEHLSANLEGPIEIILCGQNNDEANVFPRTDIDDIQKLASLIKLRAIQSVNLNLIDLRQTVVFSTLASCLAGSSSINSLNVNGSFIGDGEIRNLIPALRSNCGLTELALINSNISVEGMRLLRPIISGCITLSTLKISTRGWSDVLAQELAEALLLREKDLDVLEVTGGISSSGIELLSQVEVKSKLNTISTILIAWCCLKKKLFSHFSSDTVNFSDNLLEDAGAELVRSSNQYDFKMKASNPNNKFIVLSRLRQSYRWRGVT
jgi:hypothetical protein